MTRIRRAAKSTLIAMASCLSMAQAAAESPPPMDFFEVADAAIADLCDSRVVLLGEPADHGRGETLLLKSRIAYGLIESCGFDVLLFESDFYDFARLHGDVQAGGSADYRLIASSVGGIWNRYAEVQSLFTELSEVETEFVLSLGGLDHNLGSAGAFYSLDAMPSDLVALVDPDRRESCQAELRRLIYFRYGQEGPTPSAVEPVLACVEEMLEGVQVSERSMLERSVMRQTLINIRSYARAVTQPLDARLQERETAFFDNFKWWQRAMPEDAKFIIWGASVHFAKSSEVVERFSGLETAGAMIAEAYGNDAHFVSFAAVRGSYRFLNREAQPLPDPLPGSVEDLYRDTQRHRYRYLDRTDVEALGSRPAAILTARPVEAEIASITDSLIIIGTERPPIYTPD